MSIEDHGQTKVREAAADLLYQMTRTPNVNPETYTTCCNMILVSLSRRLNNGHQECRVTCSKIMQDMISSGVSNVPHSTGVPWGPDATTYGYHTPLCKIYKQIHIHEYIVGIYTYIHTLCSYPTD